MSPYDLTYEQRVPRPRDEVFSFFSRPENLARITPLWMRFRILTPSPVPMHAGALIDYQIQLGPLPTHWRTMITAYDPPNRFVDEQLAGPYSFWHHTHEFEDLGGETMIKDRVRYLLPAGPLGRIAHGLLIRRQLAAVFDHRRRVIADLFPGDDRDHT